MPATSGAVDNSKPTKSERKARVGRVAPTRRWGTRRCHLHLTICTADEGAQRERKRVGRGHGSGKGKTAGRGTKGQKSRTGPGVRRGFEGGQLPIQKRMPYKRGFTNIYKTPWEVVNLGRLEAIQVEGPITPEVLFAQGVIRGLEFPVKILGGGELTRPVVVHAHAFSDAARERIEARWRIGRRARADRRMGAGEAAHPPACR